ncbi:hypothetical protein G6F31_019309 [Rhizopus arrhizus]|nr:hypothetical protein G6F31_019309 [Rhizopus arrhizus]KAG1391688.1 hypothetical protein G6F59_014820 [Rhizopus arrhizus]
MRELGFNIFEYKPFPLDAPVDYRNLLPDPIIAPDGEDEGGRNPLLGGSAAGSNAGGGSTGRTLPASKQQAVRSGDAAAAYRDAAVVPRQQGGQQAAAGHPQGRAHGPACEVAGGRPPHRGGRHPQLRSTQRELQHRRRGNHR